MKATLGQFWIVCQIYLVLNVESEIQILIGFYHIALLQTTAHVSINAQVLHTWFAK